ncbi:MAG: copper chaperone PCu(A)C [Methylophilaceae bacterium]
MLALAVGSVQADDRVQVSNAWVRASAPGQDVGAAYMTLQSMLDTSLVKVESPVAGSVEIHSMTMKNGIMKMRMLDTFPLYAGKPAKLEPGGFHLMLFDLKNPLKSGEKVEFALYFKDSAGKTSTINVSLPVKRISN